MLDGSPEGCPQRVLNAVPFEGMRFLPPKYIETTWCTHSNVSGSHWDSFAQGSGRSRRALHRAPAPPPGSPGGGPGGPNLAEDRMCSSYKFGSEFLGHAPHSCDMMMRLLTVHRGCDTFSFGAGTEPVLFFNLETAWRAPKSAAIGCHVTWGALATVGVAKLVWPGETLFTNRRGRVRSCSVGPT